MDLYCYKATVVRVYDGDTPILYIDKGWEEYKQSRVRLARINAPELTSTDPATKALAIQARDYLANLIPVGSTVYLKSNVFDNYGRVLGEIYINQTDTKSVSDLMLESGLVKPMSLKTQLKQINEGKLI